MTKFCDEKTNKIVSSTSLLASHSISHLIPRASSALTRERLGNPRVLVRPVPDGDTDAPSDTLARLDHRRVVGLLLLEQRRRRRELHADVELGEGDLHTRGGETLEVGLQARGQLADDEVALEADAVERDVLRLERLDEVEHRGGLRARPLDVVVVDVELRVGVGGPRSVERDLDVGRAERVVEDIRTPGAVVVEGLWERYVSRDALEFRRHTHH